VACKVYKNKKSDHEYDTTTNIIHYNNGVAPCDPSTIMPNSGCVLTGFWNSGGGCPELCPGCTYYSTDAAGVVTCGGDSSCMSGCTPINELSKLNIPTSSSGGNHTWVALSWVLGAFIVLAVLYRYKFRKPSA